VCTHTCACPQVQAGGGNATSNDGTVSSLADVGVERGGQIFASYEGFLVFTQLPWGDHLLFHLNRPPTLFAQHMS